MYLSWLGIIRLGFIQMALGSLVSIAASTFNRVMVVELSLLQIIPGLLLALHYFIQISRPNWGFLSDRGGNRTFWIITGVNYIMPWINISMFRYFTNSKKLPTRFGIINFCLYLNRNRCWCIWYFFIGSFSN